MSPATQNKNTEVTIQFRKFVLKVFEPLAPMLKRQETIFVTDQQLLISTVREAGKIISDHLEAGGPRALHTLSRLIAVLDNEDLARAIERLEKGHGLRVIK